MADSDLNVDINLLSAEIMQESVFTSTEEISIDQNLEDAGETPCWDCKDQIQLQQTVS